MAKDEIILDDAELLRTVTLGVKMPRLFGLRMTIATKLFILAGWVLDTNVVIEISDDTEDAHQEAEGDWTNDRRDTYVS